MANITVTTNIITGSNSGYLLTNNTGTSTVNGTPENFDFVFPAKDETCYIIVSNGSVATASAVLVSNSANNGFTPTTATIPTGRTVVFAIESGYVKSSSGKITLTITPASSTTVSGSGIKVHGIYRAVALH